MTTERDYERQPKVTTTERVARNVRTIARAREVTMKQLSKRMGYRNEQVLYTRLSGESKMSVTELEQLADILAVTPEVLLSDPSTLLERTKPWLSVSADQPVYAAA